MNTTRVNVQAGAIVLYSLPHSELFKRVKAAQALLGTEVAVLFTGIAIDSHGELCFVNQPHPITIGLRSVRATFDDNPTCTIKPEFDVWNTIIIKPALPIVVD